MVPVCFTHKQDREGNNYFPCDSKEVHQKVSEKTKQAIDHRDS